jgi:hypothetical protein
MLESSLEAVVAVAVVKMPSVFTKTHIIMVV